MEDYKEKYEQAMLRMNKWVEGSEIIDTKEVAEFVFPELKESEENIIRNRIIGYLKQDIEEHPERKARICEMIAWLEKQGEQKPAWNKEYREMRMKVLKYLSTRCNVDEYEEVERWLKSLKEIYTWKPSDEQMTALRRMKAAIAGEGEIYGPLNSLYEDLKKLREE